MTLPAVLKAPMMEMRMLAWELVKPRSSDILIVHSQYNTVDYIKPMIHHYLVIHRTI